MKIKNLKKTFLVFGAVCLLALSVVGCGTAPASNSSAAPEIEVVPPSSAVQPPSPTEGTDKDEAPLQENSASSVLVVTFTRAKSMDLPDGIDAVASASVNLVNNEYQGNTEILANWIAQKTNADMVFLETTDLYPADYDETVERGRIEEKDGARPALKTQIDNIEKYNTVFLGFPNWWYDMPMPVYTFLDAYDLSGKTIIPFVTHGGSGFSDAINSLKAEEPEATVLDGYSVKGTHSPGTQDDLQTWIKTLDLPLTTATNSAAPQNSKIRVRMTYEGGETIAVLEDNPTTQSLLAQLPATVSFSDYASSEKIAYFDEKLSREDAPEGDDPEIGDVACYGPWGNLVFFYGDQPYASGVIPMGRIESGLDTLSTMSGDFEATIELIK